MSSRRKADRPVRVGDSSRWPAFVFVEPGPEFDATTRRGGPYFDTVAEMGMNVTRIERGANGGRSAVPVRRPWTFLYVPVQTDDAAEWLPWFQERTCSVIMDVHFPVMRQETVLGDDATILEVLEHREQMITNLSLACAVTVSQEAWTADLAEVNPNVWFLPDIEPGDDDSLTEFTIKFSEILQDVAVACRERHPLPTPAGL